MEMLIYKLLAQYREIIKVTRNMIDLYFQNHMYNARIYVKKLIYVKDTIVCLLLIDHCRSRRMMSQSHKY